jgi:ketosteroid isomerase-like protein
MMVCCCVLLAFSTTGLAGDPEGIEGVNKLLDRIEKAHAARDLKMLSDECVDETLVTIAIGGTGPDRRAHVMTKKQVLAATAKHTWEKRGLKTRRMTDRDITAGQSDLGIVSVTVTDTFQDGRTTAYRTVYIARRRAGVWRICFSMPRIFRPTLVAASVKSGSAAEKSGLKPGDDVAVLGGVKTDSFTVMEKIKPVLTPGDDRKEVSLIVRRGKRRVPFTIPIGVGAVRFEPRLMPLAPGKLAVDGRLHPAGKLLQREVEISKSGKPKDYDALFHPEAFFSFRPQPGKPTKLLGLEDGKKAFVEVFQYIRKTLDLDKFSLGRIDVITDGDIAMVTGQVSVTIKETGRQATRPTRTQIYVRMGEKWAMVANLVNRIRYGLSVDSSGSVGGVNQLLDRIEKAYASHDAKMLIEQCLDDGLLGIGVTGAKDARKALVITKPQMTIAGVKKGMQTVGFKSRRYTERDIMLVKPDIAFLRTTAIDQTDKGPATTHREFCIAHESGGTWRICFSMPQIFRHTMAIAYVLPGSKAARAGLKVGDEVIACAGIKTDTFMSTKKIDSLLKSEPKEVVLTVRVGGREMSVTIPGSHGLGGTGFAPTLMPLAPAVFVGRDKPHPAGQLLRRELEILKTGQPKDYDEIFHPSAFFSFRPQPGKPTQLLDLANGKKMFIEELQQSRKVLDMDKCRLDQIDVITNGDIAMVTGRISVTFKETGKQMTIPTRAQVYVRQDDKWLMLANLIQRFSFGLPEAPRPGAEKAKAVTAIQAIISKWNAGRAAGKKGAAIVGETFSDTAFVAIGRGPKLANVHGKAEALRRRGLMYERMGGRGFKLGYTSGTIHVAGFLAYEIGKSTRKNANGRELRPNRIMNFFAKESSGWKLVTALPVEQIRKVFDTPTPEGGTGLSKSDKEAVAFVQDVVARGKKMLAKGKGAGALARELASNGAFAFLASGPDQVCLVDKAARIKMLDGWIPSQATKNMRETLKAVAVFGAMTYAISEFNVQSADGKEVRQQWLNIYARERVGWKCVFSTSAQGVRDALAAADKTKR